MTLGLEYTFETLVLAARNVNYSLFASLMFLVYDHVLTLDVEGKNVWGRRWTLGKFLFLFNRYFGPLTLIFNMFVILSQSSCNSFHWWETTSVAVAVLGAELVLIGRIYAVYDCNKKLLAILAALFVAEVASVLGIVYLGLPQGIPRPFKGLTGCYVADQPGFYWITWLPALVFETILCILMLYKAWRMYSAEYSSPLLRILVRDSVLYFISMLAVMLVNCLVWALASPNVQEVALGWAVALPCSLGSRLLLNMRQGFYENETSHGEPDVSINFCEGQVLVTTESLLPQYY